MGHLITHYNMGANTKQNIIKLDPTVYEKNNTSQQR